MTLTLLALLAALPARAEVPHGAELDDAIAVDITAEGFESLPLALGALVPETIAVPDVDLREYDEECIEWWWGDETCWNWWEYYVNVNNMQVGVQIADLDMRPDTGRIDVTARAQVWLNSSTDPIRVRAGAAVFEGISISADCRAWLEPVDVDIATSVYMSVVDGPEGRAIDAEVSPIDWSWSLAGEDIQFSNCGIADIQDFFDGAFFDFINFNPWEEALDLAIDAAEGSVDGPIQDLAAEIEPALEDAFSAAQVHTDVELGDSVMSVDIWPQDLYLEPDGMRIQLGGAIKSDIHPCMDAYNPAGSRSTEGALPPLGFAADSIPIGHHLGIFVDDDLINQALYSVWAGGLLCFTIDESMGDSLPVPVDTTLLSLVAGDAFNDYFPESERVEIITRPRSQPFAALEDDHDLTAHVDKLGLDIYAELDGRMARMVGVDLAADAGIDLGFVGTTGELSVDIAFEPSEVRPTVRYVELAPESGPAIEQQLTGLMGVIVEPLIGDLLTDIRFGLPSIEGLGVQTLDHARSGDGGEHIGIYSQVGLVEYNNGGCDGEGCSDPGASCGGGCAVGGATAPSRLVYGTLLLLAVARRRRRPTA